MQKTIPSKPCSPGESSYSPSKTEMIHHFISEDLTGPRIVAADSYRSQRTQGLCLEKDHSLWPAVGTSPEAIEKRAKMFRLNHELFRLRLTGSFSEAQAEMQCRLLAELGDKVLPVKSSHFMIIMELVRLYLQGLCDFDDDDGDYDHLIHCLDNIEENSFFVEELLFGREESEQLLRVLQFFQAEAYWREDFQYALQYKLAHTYWLCAAHMKAVNGHTLSMPMWEPFSETEVAEAIDHLVDFIEVNPEFMVIC